MVKFFFWDDSCFCDRSCAKQVKKDQNNIEIKIMADIKINAAEWNALSTEQQNEIHAILRRAGSLGRDDKIVPDAAAPEVGLAIADAIQPEGFWCKLACNAAEAAAVVACGALSGPAAAVCIAAAHSAGEFCRSKCD